MEVGANFEKRVVWLKENVLFINLDEKIILVDTNQRIHYTPNPSAAFILKFLVNDSSVHFSDLLSALMTEYNIPIDQARPALHNALNDFDSKKIIGHREVLGNVPVDLLGEESQALAALGQSPPLAPTQEGYPEASLVQGGTLISLGRVAIVKNVYVG